MTIRQQFYPLTSFVYCGDAGCKYVWEKVTAVPQHRVPMMPEASDPAKQLMQKELYLDQAMRVLWCILCLKLEMMHRLVEGCTIVCCWSVAQWCTLICRTIMRVLSLGKRRPVVPSWLAISFLLYSTTISLHNTTGEGKKGRLFSALSSFVLCCWYLKKGFSY